MKRTALELVVGLLSAYILFAGSSALAQQMTLQSFDGPLPPVNKEGRNYPMYYDGGAGTGGPMDISIDTTDKVSGAGSLKLVSTRVGSTFYAQFNPYDGVGREFTRTYAACGWPASCGDPASWQFNTYNRLRFWIKAPPEAADLRGSGRSNCQMGTYVKRVTNPSYTSDEDGGDHFYHGFNIPNLNAWTQVIMNWHPDHERSLTNVDPGVRPYPTSGDPPNTYNYWDALTRFYIECVGVLQTVPAVWHLDQIEFYKEPYTENDVSVSSLTGTYVPSTNRIIVSWERQPSEDPPSVEIRYSFSNIHTTGWSSATPAPGSINPPGGGFYIGMSYDTTALPLSGQSTVYIGIKPTSSSLFSQIAIPLSGGGAPPPPPPPSGPGLPPAPTGLIVTP